MQLQKKYNSTRRFEFSDRVGCVESGRNERKKSHQQCASFPIYKRACSSILTRARGYYVMHRAARDRLYRNKRRVRDTRPAVADPGFFTVLHGDSRAATRVASIMSITSSAQE